MNFFRQKLCKLSTLKILKQGTPFQSRINTRNTLYTNSLIPRQIGSIFYSPKYYFSRTITMEESYDETKPERILISNPTSLPESRKILKDLRIGSPKTIEEFRELIGADEEEFTNSLKTLGIQYKENHKLKMEEMEILAMEYDCIVVPENARTDTPLRPPIMTIMGHVDHGKTTLLDSLRNSNIADGEFGGITQKIGAFMVKTSEGRNITFIDTPGHEAFSNMRKRGSLCTDMVILVVSAIDGCQPQTFEAIEHARRAGVPIIVAVNKIDKGGNPEEVEQELFDYGLNIEPFGGNVPVVHISAKFKRNIDLLEELILFEAELMELKADPQSIAEGMILESKRSTENEAKACTIVVQKGTLKVGDYIVAGTHYGKVRQIKDDKGHSLKEAGPSFAVEVIGLKELPDNGDVFFVVSDENKARIVANRRQSRKEALEKQEADTGVRGTKIKFKNSRERRAFHSGKKEVVMEKLSEQEALLLEKIGALKEQGEDDSKLKELETELEAHKLYVKEMVDINHDDSIIHLIVKAQDKGTLETLIEQINKVAANQQDFIINILSTSVGNVTESEIRDAKNFRATILGMDIRCPGELETLARMEKIPIKTFKLIYDVLDEIKALAQRGGVGKPIEEVTVKGTAMIKQVFEVKLGKNNLKKVAGMSVSKGNLNKKFKYRVLRANKVIAEGLTLSALKHHKDEVNEIRKGQDCGLSFFDFDEFKEGDLVEAYEVRVIKPEEAGVIEQQKR